jgi:hypothetical protein
MADRFFIAPYDTKSGQQNNVRPWLIPDEAFEVLNNAYVYRGRIRKRFGSRYMGDNVFLSRLRLRVGTTNAITGNATINLPNNFLSVGQIFSVNSTVFTVTALGAAAPLLSSIYSTTPLITATINSTSNPQTLTIVGNGLINLNSVVYWYLANPVMGLLTYEVDSVKSERIIGFDTRYAYEYTTGWQRLSAGASVWSGNDSDFFWGETWTGANAADKIFFVTNNTTADGIRYFDGTTWFAFTQYINSGGGAGNLINTAKLIFAFKNRLVLFDPVIGGVRYRNRAIWCQIGSPIDVSNTAWSWNIPGKGSGIDATTTEEIVGGDFVGDRLIIFFEKSTWEFVFNNNQAYPFSWYKINTELGAESTFSVVPFDRVCLGVSNIGIMACNGNSVERIDDKIPETTFTINNTAFGPERIHGIRDYFVEMVYWTYTDSTEDPANFPFPNRVLVYDYKTSTWAFNNDSITTFGYFNQDVGITWNSVGITWDDPISWDTGANRAKFRQVVGGNQQGFTFIVDSQESKTNAAVIQITKLTSNLGLITVVSYDHNVELGEYLYFEGITNDSGDTLTLMNNKIFEVNAIVDRNTFTFVYFDNTSIVPDGVYTGGGLASRVSNIIIRTKQYNFYADKGRNALINQVYFMVNKTSKAQTQVQFYVSTSDVNIINNPATPGTLIGTSTLDCFPYDTTNSSALNDMEQFAERLWHPVYIQADGQCIQLQLKMNDTQMRDTEIRLCDFQLHAMCFYSTPTSNSFY